MPTCLDFFLLLLCLQFLHGPILAQFGTQYGGSECPLGQKRDGTCSGLKWFCVDPKEKCYNGVCCQPSQSQSSQLPYGTCPMGTFKDGTCNKLSICVDPRETCINGVCCQQGSGDGNDAGQWGGGGFPSPIGGGSACPQGQEVDGYCNGLKSFCIDPKENCYNGVCCQPSKKLAPQVPPGSCPIGTIQDGTCNVARFCWDLRETCINGICCQQSGGNNGAYGQGGYGAYGVGISPYGNNGQGFGGMPPYGGISPYGGYAQNGGYSGLSPYNAGGGINPYAGYGTNPYGLGNQLGGGNYGTMMSPYGSVGSYGGIASSPYYSPYSGGLAGLGMSNGLGRMPVGVGTYDPYAALSSPLTAYSSLGSIGGLGGGLGGGGLGNMLRSYYGSVLSGMIGKK